MTKRMATKRTTAARRNRATPKRGSGRRELLKSRNAAILARRTSQGRIKEMDERGRPLTADQRRKAKTGSASGYGDKADRRVA